MQAAVFNNTDNPLNTEDYASLRAAIEVYARWLDAQEIINSSTEEKTNDKRMKVLELLGLEKSNKKEIKYSELRHLYLCKTDFNKNPS
ncbi:hypothetical protein BMR07_13455 [Methylococcaceae bacterium CS1]|nr:hypothetical protein [Methyloprofundus sp.]TXK94588.1 hypothetical protein BMR10_12700 [Methylococcaceae bacterium CS4]TXK99091.1 hypothetical protein BMR11_07035 [Methylococcaceae bacterium CS5]TXL04074.1 hypothetical protein BMR07_13455 [Methylococcaceae bacterium CS1]TXL06675.1 hypothetical protein BMR09_07690 [Methylococcaceae bacterium CS3]TXL10808.1 hypothetical protein BMR08_07535 [Methylococcaceae bacterium CS2]